MAVQDTTKGNNQTTTRRRFMAACGAVAGAAMLPHGASAAPAGDVAGLLGAEYRREVEHFARKVQAELDGGAFEPSGRCHPDDIVSTRLTNLANRLELDPELAAPSAIHRAARIAAGSPRLAQAVEEGEGAEQTLPSLAAMCLALDILGAEGVMS